MIGVFDSGFGGLTILKELVKKLPQYDYVYLGDNARAPYGGKSQDVIYNYTKEAVDFLFFQGCELIIIACNTSSAKALRKIQREYLPAAYPDKKVLGVIIPAAEVAAEKINSSGKNRIGVIGTRSTIESKAYERELSKFIKDPEIHAQACPLLVPLVEEGMLKRVETKMILKKYLRPLKEKKIDVLILGCTHYPFLLDKIEKIMGKSVKIINTPEAVGIKLEDYLKRHKETEEKLKKSRGRLFFTTDSEDKFISFSRKYLPETEIDVKKILL